MAFLLLANLTLTVVVRQPSGVVWWMACVWFGVALITSWAHSATGLANERIARRMQGVWLAALTSGSLLTLLSPAATVGLVIDSAVASTVAQIVALGVLVLCLVVLWPNAQELLVPRVGAPGRESAVTAQRVRTALLVRRELVLRYAGLMGLTAVVWGVVSVQVGSTLFAVWVALLLAWFLVLESRMEFWRRETVDDGFTETDPDAGRRGYQVWWACAVSWTLAATVYITLRSGGTPFVMPWLYLVILATALFLATYPRAWVRAHADEVVARAVRRRPELAELGL